MDKSLEFLFNGPIYTRHWNIKTTEELLLRFGFFLKSYDKAGDLGLDYHRNILTPLEVRSPVVVESKEMVVTCRSPCPYYLSKGSIGDLEMRALCSPSFKFLKVIDLLT